MSKNDLTISEMIEQSYKLWEKHKESWSPMEPKYGRDFILYMIEEIGEVIAIIKKKKEDNIMDDPLVREQFIEEMADVLMFFIDVLNRFDVSAEEFSSIYCKKHLANMSRDYKKQHEEFLAK